MKNTSVCVIAIALFGCGLAAEANVTPNEALVEAVRSNDVSAAKRALTEGANPDVEYVWTGLTNIDELHEFRAPVLLKALDWNTPVSGCLLAVQLEAYRRARVNEPLVQLLLDAGASANCREPDGRPVIQFALVHCSRSVVGMLVDHGARVDDWPAGQTCLALAAGSCRGDNVRLLLSRGEQVDRRDAHGRTALMAVAASPALRPSLDHDLVDTATALLENHADVNAADDDGVTPLMLAAMYHRTELVRLLLNYGADSTLRDNGNRLMIPLPGGVAELPRRSPGRSALDYAAGYLPITRLLERSTRRLNGHGVTTEL